MMQRHLHKAFCDTERDHIGDLPGAVVVEVKSYASPSASSAFYHASLDGMDPFFRTLRFGSNVGLRPIPYFHLICGTGFGDFALRQRIKMAVHQERAVAEIDLKGVLTKGLR
ncbi:hypothetical protein [Bradyrhizobium sp. RDM4]|uniref:hypothetical protein n=1 Tax=Bradyrhizobium sp. RDM4 TaxID=3378765 RepID=UPI0038FD21D3